MAKLNAKKCDMAMAKHKEINRSRENAQGTDIQNGNQN